VGGKIQEMQNKMIFSDILISLILGKLENPLEISKNPYISNPQPFFGQKTLQSLLKRQKSRFNYKYRKPSTISKEKPHFLKSTN
jgi:hypothetical protein